MKARASHLLSGKNHESLAESGTANGIIGAEIGGIRRKTHRGCTSCGPRPPVEARVAHNLAYLHWPT